MYSPLLTLFIFILYNIIYSCQTFSLIEKQQQHNTLIEKKARPFIRNCLLYFYPFFTNKKLILRNFQLVFKIRDRDTLHNLSVSLLTKVSVRTLFFSLRKLHIFSEHCEDNFIMIFSSVFKCAFGNRKKILYLSFKKIVMTKLVV